MEDHFYNISHLNCVPVNILCLIYRRSAGCAYAPAVTRFLPLRTFLASGRRTILPLQGPQDSGSSGQPRAPTAAQAMRPRRQLSCVTPPAAAVDSRCPAAPKNSSLPGSKWLCFASNPSPAWAEKSPQNQFDAPGNIRRSTAPPRGRAGYFFWPDWRTPLAGLRHCRTGLPSPSAADNSSSGEMKGVTIVLNAR